MTNKPWQYYDPIFEYEKVFQDIEWPWSGHKRFVYDFIRNIKPKSIAELGKHKGTSFFSMCQAVKDGGLTTGISAVDTWEGDPHAGFYDESVFTDVKKIVKTYYKTLNTHLIRKTFDDAVGDFNKSSIDLLHIDGLHTYQAVKHDLVTWIGKVKPTGVILFHDTHEKQDDFGVYKLWDELKKQYAHLDFYHSHGLGVTFLNQNQTEIIDFNSIWQRYYDVYYKYDTVSYQNSMLTKQTRSQSKRIASQAHQLLTLKTNLNTIQSAKFYRLWQGYNSIKRSLRSKLSV